VSEFAWGAIIVLGGSALIGLIAGWTTPKQRPFNEAEYFGSFSMRKPSDYADGLGPFAPDKCKRWKRMQEINQTARDAQVSLIEAVSIVCEKHGEPVPASVQQGVNIERGFAGVTGQHEDYSAHQAQPAPVSVPVAHWWDRGNQSVNLDPSDTRLVHLPAPYIGMGDETQLLHPDDIQQKTDGYGHPVDGWPVKQSEHARRQ
jgi:hypothetical protein